MELEKLITENYCKLYNYIYAQFQNRFDAEDAVSETVMTAINRYSTLRDKSKALPWLFGIARNIVLRRRLKSGFELQIPEDLELPDTISVPLPETVERAEDAEKIRGALSYLSKDYRQVMIERYYNEKSYSEISGAFSIPVSLVSYRLNEGRKQLKEVFIKMDAAMKNSYYKPGDLQLDVRYTGKLNIARLTYEVMNNLLAKNIAIICYEESLTVTEISHTLGVAAVYVEETLEKMLRLSCLGRKGNRYQTAFPIVTGQMLERIRALAVPESAGMYEAVADEMKRAIPSLLSVDEIAAFGELNEKQAMYFLYTGMRFKNDNWLTPYDMDLEYPNHAYDCKWTYKAYMPPDVMNGKTRIWQYHLVSDSDPGKRVHFIFDCGLSGYGSEKFLAWNNASTNDSSGTIFDAADGKTPADDLLKKAGIINESGALSCLYFSSNDAHEKAFQTVEPVIRLRNDLMARSKDKLINETKKLYPKRFHNDTLYVNCELRDIIFFGFEDYLMKNDLLEPVNYLILDREEQKISEVFTSYL